MTSGGVAREKDWGPVWFIETEDGAFDHFKDNTAATSGLSATSGHGHQLGFLQCHPRAFDNVHSPGGHLNSSAEERPQNAYFFSGSNALGETGALPRGKWSTGAADDDLQWSSPDWFTQQLYYPEGNLAGRAIRIGVFFPEYWSGSTHEGSVVRGVSAPPPIGVVTSFSFEVYRRETTR